VFSILLILGCFSQKKYTNTIIGVVDVIEHNVCKIQIKDDIITLTSDMCFYLKEGDLIKVSRVK